MPRFIQGAIVYITCYGETHVGIVDAEPVMDGGEYWYLIRLADGKYKFPEEDITAIDPEHSMVCTDFSGYELKSGGFLRGFYKYVEGNDLKRHMRSSKLPLSELFDAGFFVQTDVSISFADFMDKRLS